MLTDRQTSHANSLGLFTERVPKGNDACLQAFENELLRTTLSRCDLALYVHVRKVNSTPLMRSRREARVSWVRSEVQICSIPNRHRIWSENEILLLHLCGFKTLILDSQIEEREIDSKAKKHVA